MNVSSIVVKTKSVHIQEVMDNINALDFCEVHFSGDDGRIVVTIEGKSIDEQMERMKKIQSMPYVYSASLSYSYCEEELSDSLDKIKNQTSLY